MRLWHIDLLKYLPKLQLLSQKREMDLIWKNLAMGVQTNHILINYVWEYDEYEKELYVYYKALEKEFKRRNFKFNHSKYCLANYDYIIWYQPFKQHHNFRYLEQCYYNLEEKYDRKQKDFDLETYLKLRKFYMNEKKDFYNE